MKTLLTTKGQEIIIDDDTFSELGHLTWTINTQGYPCHNFWKAGKSKVVLLHQYIMGKQKGMVIDHKNREKLDNRKENLRFVSPRENQINRKLQDGRKFRGVSFNRLMQKWEAYCFYINKKIHIGFFGSEERAALARDIEAAKYHGSAIVLNFSNPLPI